MLSCLLHAHHCAKPWDSGANENQSWCAEVSHLVEEIFNLAEAKKGSYWKEPVNLWLSWRPWAARPPGNLESGSGKSGHSLLNPHSVLVLFSLSLPDRPAFSVRQAHGQTWSLHNSLHTSFLINPQTRLSPDPNAQETALGGAAS